jgi:CHAD domain-containing protein
MEPSARHWGTCELLSLPCDPKQDPEVRKFARQVVLDAQAEVERRRQASVENVAAMHALRIGYKRLRYAIEAFHGSLPLELRAWRDVAVRFQGILGDMHDHDVAINVVQTTDGLVPETRARAIEALRWGRTALSVQYLELSGQSVPAGS